MTETIGFPVWRLGFLGIDKWREMQQPLHWLAVQRPFSPTHPLPAKMRRSPCVAAASFRSVHTPWCHASRFTRYASRASTRREDKAGGLFKHPVRRNCGPSVRCPAARRPLTAAPVAVPLGRSSASGYSRCRTGLPVSVLPPYLLWPDEPEVRASSWPAQRQEPSFGRDHTRVPRNRRPAGYRLAMHGGQNSPPSA